MSMKSIDEQVDVLIIGAGISGITAGIDMLRVNNNRNFVILEKGHRVGGTWSDNEYPGCCCDVWSHLYSLSFSPNPNWTREYPTQPEIQRYLANVVNEFDLERHISFGSEVEGCSFDSASGMWTTTVRRGTRCEAQEIRSRFVVSAVGQLSRPNYPKISGLDDFAGKVMHSARWDKSCDLRGKRVGVIGNGKTTHHLIDRDRIVDKVLTLSQKGATAIQIVPELAKIAKSLVVFQRSPNWMTPRNNATIPIWRQTAYRYVPSLRQQYRASLMDIREKFWKVLVDTDSVEHQSVKELSIQMLNSQLPGADKAELRKALTPNYPPGCKRILISDDYYTALGKPTVTLETAAIVEATSSGLSVSAGWNSAQDEHEAREHPLDAIICATGFQATEFLSPMRVKVPDQDTLAERWRRGAYAYKGMTVPGLPNFAIMYGPNTNLGHNSIILMIEAQSSYINRLIGAVLKSPSGLNGNPLRIWPKESVTRAWNEKLQASLSLSTLASSKCSSWYKSETGLITTNWSEDVIEYQRQVSAIDWDDYDVWGDGAAELRAGGSITWPRVKEESQPWKFSSLSLLSFGMMISVLAAARLINDQILPRSLLL